jgi:4-carboxymuconolactone decarboxylase
MKSDGSCEMDVPAHCSKQVSGGVLPALTYQQAVRLFGEEGTAEFIYLVGLYCMVSVTLNGFDVPIPDVDESRKPPAVNSL